MALLLDLSIELLLKIIALVRGYGYKERYRPIWPLSLTCKHLNACCGHVLFRRYYLQFRVIYYHRSLTRLDTRRTLNKWNTDAVVARLQHLRSKAFFVRTVVLLDCGSNEEGEPETFPSCIIPELLDVLDTLQGLTAFVVRGPCKILGTLPLPLWNWVTKTPLRCLEIDGIISPPANAQINTNIQEFGVWLCDPTISFTEACPHLDT
jgi:hypothetical protein